MQYVNLTDQELDLLTCGMTQEDLNYEKHVVEDLQVELLIKNILTPEEKELYKQLDSVYCLMNYYLEEIWQYYYKEAILDENLINNTSIQTIEKTRTQKRSQIIKEELMSKAWHPDRVEKLLTAGYSFEDVFGD